MKKTLILSILISIFFIARSQNYEKVETLFKLRRFDMAKTEIDEIAKTPKAQNKPVTYLWKAAVYASIYKTDSLKTKNPDAFKVADESFEKALESYAQLKDDTGYLRNASIDLYEGSFGDAYAAFSKKKWDDALTYFSNAVKYSDIFFPRKWTTLPQLFDTAAILYAGYAAQNAQKPEEALKFYKRLIESNVTSLKSEGSLDGMYKNTLLLFIDHKDSANFYHYYPICKQVFPKEDWELYESEYFNRNYTLYERVKLYDQKNADGALSESQYSDFGDMFFNLHKEDKDKLDSTQIATLQLKALDAYKHAFEKNNKNTSAAFNVAVIYYTDFLSLDDKVRTNIKALRDINSNKPVEKDPKKKAALDAKYKTLAEPYIKANQALEGPSMETVNNSIEWFEKAFNVLKDKKAGGTPFEGTEKKIYSTSVDKLAVLYDVKRTKVKGKDPKSFDEYDAKFKLYDGLHTDN